MIISPQLIIHFPLWNHNCPWTICSYHMVSPSLQSVRNVRRDLFVLIPETLKHRMPFLHIPILQHLSKHQVFFTKPFSVLLKLFNILFHFSCKTFWIRAFHSSLGFIVMCVLGMNFQIPWGQPIFYNFLYAPQHQPKDTADPQ